MKKENQPAKDKTLHKTFEIKSKLGLHARPAALFVQTANRFNSEIEVTNEGEKKEERETVNGKSIMGIMTLAAGVGARITVTIKGDDAGEAMAEISKLFANNFGE